MPRKPKTEQAPSPTSKIEQIKALLARSGGATLAELVEATGWQPHTTRAALTGLRKKGHAIAKDKRGDVTCYRSRATWRRWRHCRQRSCARNG
jgi:predicted ArsR family transcriptional regulator